MHATHSNSDEHRLHPSAQEAQTRGETTVPARVTFVEFTKYPSGQEVVTVHFWSIVKMAPVLQ